jgi:hypothetical protein
VEVKSGMKLHSMRTTILARGCVLQKSYTPL